MAPCLVNIPLIALMLLAGCNSPVKGEAPDGLITARTLYRSTLCGGQQAAPQLRWMTAEDAYHELYPRLVPGDADGRQASPPVVDFSENAVLLISMGQRRTGGYSLELSDEPPRLSNGVLTVPVVWTVPAEGLFVAQVITHPCLILALPGQGIRSVTVVDQGGSVQLSSELR